MVKIFNAKMIGAPEDRLTRIASAALSEIEGHAEGNGTERAIILLIDGDSVGDAMLGFETPDEAIDFMLTHVKSMCEAADIPYLITREI